MYLQGVNNVYDLTWAPGVRYGDVHHRQEVEGSSYNFTESDPEMLFGLFASYEKECLKLVEKGLVQPGFEYCLKCSHTFNLLDARGAISVTERTGYIKRVRRLARLSAEAHLKLRESLGFPLLTAIGERAPFMVAK
jgi:glycyl-tRNA synthetase alpha chain